MTQAMAYFAAAVGQRGEVLESEYICPCGEPALFGQMWFTEWFDTCGLVEKYVVTRLCVNHKARKPGEKI